MAHGIPSSAAGWPDASLSGALSLEPYLAEDDIAIEAPRIPCWLAETAPVG